jgi:mannose-6-phosphate isomerase-like protein (cupin superfamily)
VRALRVVLLVAVFGCVARPPVVSLPPGVLDLDAFLASHPLPPDGDIRADQIGRSDGASYHLVQVHGSERPHRHATHDLVVHVLRGHGVLTRSGRRVTLAAGDSAVVPRAESHWFASDPGETAVALVVFAPPLDAPDSVPVDER